MVSIDGTRGGFQLMIDGWLQADVDATSSPAGHGFGLLRTVKKSPEAHREGVFYPTRRRTVAEPVLNLPSCA
jgi:hypothetical protein